MDELPAPAEAGKVVLSLPPRVTDRVSGYLVMKVDEVLWARQHPGEVSAAVQWWGEETPTTFRPVDVSQQGLLGRYTSAIYEIRTSRELFGSYLVKCGSLTIAVADKFGMPIGCAKIPDLQHILKVSPFQNYYPIINAFGNRIGDIHVSFNLRMTSPLPVPALHSKPVPKVNEGIKSKKFLKRLSPSGKRKDKLCKSPEKREKSEAISSCKSRVTQEKKTTTQSVSRGKDTKTFNKTTNIFNLNGKRQPLNDNVPNKSSKNTETMISKILERGRRIRDAMALDVVEQDISTCCENTISKKLFKNVEDSAELCVLYDSKGSSSDIKEYINGMKIGRQEVVSDKEKKILDFLAGKAMTETEEKEAVEALRNTTPSKDILSKVSKPFCEEEHFVSKKSSEVSHATEDAVLTPKESKCKESTFDLDAELLSRVNCLRISVRSLMLNTVGLKRIGSTLGFQKKTAKSSSSVLLPPGVTYFVEYQLPLASVSRSQLSGMVRYCSKKQIGYEVSFGDRSVHNIPTLLRSSLSEHSALASFISALTFKVCARHLNQRVPIVLGFSSPESPMFLLGSAHLRHEYELPVIAPDRLPVAKLKVCLELGRDRIHFGGILDPENNSLGLASPKESQESMASKNNMLSKKAVEGRQLHSASVTRNGSKPLRPSGARWKGKISNPYANLSSRVSKQLTAGTKEASKDLSSDPSSGQSTQRSEATSIPSDRLPSKNQKLFTCRTNQMSSSEVDSTRSARNCLQHELAITIQQICGCLPLDGTATDDKDCFVSYKFPSWDASEDAIVEWNSFSTEPTVCLQDTWFRPQCRVHSVVLPDTISLHGFLRESFKMRGMISDVDSTVVFSICVRHYGENVKDCLLAQAFLPYSLLVDLENTYCSAANGDPQFSDSSCASVAMDLPLHFSPAYKIYPSDGAGLLKIKVDYRQVHCKQSARCADFPQSHGDVAAKASPSRLPEELSHRPSGRPLAYACGVTESGPPIPKWAQTPEKLPQPEWETAATNRDSHLVGKEAPEWEAAPVYRDPYLGGRTIPTKLQVGAHATWEPTPAARYPHREQEGQHSSWTGTRGLGVSYRSVTDLVQLDDDRSEHEDFVSATSFKLGPALLGIGRHSSSCLDLYLNGGRNEDLLGTNQMNPLTDVVKSAGPLRSDGVPKDSASAGRPCSDASGRETLSGLNVGAATSRTEAQRNAVDQSTSPLLSERFDRSRGSAQGQRRATYRHASTATDTTVRSCQTSPRVNGMEPSAQVREAVSTVEDLGSDNCTPSTSTDGSSASCREQTVSEELEIPLKASVEEGESKGAILTSEGKEEGESKGAILISEGMEEGESKGAILTSEGKEEGKIPQFRAKVGVESAFHLQSARTDDNATVVFVSCHPCEISAPCQEEVTSASEVQTMHASPSVPYRSDPEWFWSWDTQLPADLLIVAIRRLVFKVWERRSDGDSKSSYLIGFAAVDLTVLTVGLPLVSGWFNIMDFTGKCRGQIKLSVEPTEDISRFRGLMEVLGGARADARGLSSSSPSWLYLAHCVYPDFPSHVVFDSDMRVRMVEPPMESPQLETPDEILSAVHRRLFQHTAPGPGSETVIPLERKTEHHDLLRPSTVSAETKGGGKEMDEDPSIRLRKKLSELDVVTRMMKAQLITDVESRRGNRPLASNWLPSRNDPSASSSQQVCGSGEGAGASEAGGECQAPHAHSHGHREAKPPRRTWDKQEELADLRSLQLNHSEEEQHEAAQLEEVAEWLSDSVMHQIFNPILFHDLINSLSPPTSSVRVVELDEDSSNNEGEMFSSGDEAKGIPCRCEYVEQRSGMQRRHGGRYRKDISQCFPSEGQHPARTGRLALSTADVDSGVDVDSSSVFHHPATAPPPVRRGNPPQHGAAGRSVTGRAISSASSSGISTLLHSTGPSSLSETPSGSPQRSRQVPHSAESSQLISK